MRGRHFLLCAHGQASKRVTLTLVFSLFVAVSATAGTLYHGKVVKIADGDTLTLLVDEKQHKIRLSDIDTPERKQPFGTRAKQALSELAFGKQARVVEVGPLRADCGAGLRGRN